MFKFRTALVLSLLFVIGCAGPIGLTSQGSYIRVSSQNAVDNCTYLGPLTSRQGGNFRNYETNIESATNDIRNQAAARGANSIVMNPPQTEDRSPSGFGGDGCNNCVTVTASAFTCR